MATKPSPQTDTSRREFFRLTYPLMGNAVLAIDGSNYTVCEVSEGGLRLRCSGQPFQAEQRVEGTLTLGAGVRCTVSGSVLRAGDGYLVLKLSRGPTSYDVIREQRHLAKQFPDWKLG